MSRYDGNRLVYSKEDFTVMMHRIGSTMEYQNFHPANAFKFFVNSGLLLSHATGGAYQHYCNTIVVVCIREGKIYFQDGAIRNVDRNTVREIILDYLVELYPEEVCKYKVRMMTDE